MSKKRLSSGINCNLFLFTACPENPDLLVILLGVMGGIVAIGIILLILWKLLTAMVVSINSHNTYRMDRVYLVTVCKDPELSCY